VFEERHDILLTPLLPAVGTVNLGHGGLSHEKTAGLADLDIEERLIRYVAGGVDPDESRRTREASDRFSLRSTDNEGETERCSTVYEGKEINTNVCAPGAILALGLMFMKSGNVSVASRLKLPDTHFLLEFVRPDFLTLLVVAHSLIMWNDVVPTKEWIEEQIPSVVLDARIQMTARAKSSLLGKSSGTGLDLNFDCRAVRQMYVHALSGACFGVGIRFAGTGNCDAKRALMERVNELHALRISSDPAVAALRPEIPILETCLCCATISLVVVMAGTGDLDVFRLLRIVRWDRVQDIKYGVHMGYAMAVGLLFLGGGKCTLGREPADIAALVTAFFPRFPSGTFDNQFHLQALRHLYVLATKPRVLQPINVKTGEHVSAKIQLKSTSGRKQLLHAPCLLLNDEDTWETLEIVSPEFYPLKLEFPLKSNRLTFYVKTLKSESAADIVYMARRHNSLCVQNFKRLVIAKDSEVSFASRVHSETDRLAAEEILPIYLRLRFGGKLTQENLNILRSYYQRRQRNGDDGDSLDCRLLLPYLQEVAIAQTQQK
jgi:anaphase-promoting complex subunit 1